MKENKSTRIFYLILVPVILVVILLNSGVLQARVPAVTISGAHYNVAQFNYYYFTAYNDFVKENFDEDGLNGPFDQSLELRDQMVDEDTSWKDYFMAQAEKMMVEVTYYSTQASVAGYAFSEEELAPVEEQLTALEAASTASGITMKNYLVAYWGVGMTEDIYTQELTRQVEAEAYAAYLEANETVTQDELDQWVEENNPDHYSAANLCMIQLNAAEDRFTGQVEEAQQQALAEKLDRLTARYLAAPETLEDLAANFNDVEELAWNDGLLTDSTKETLPAVVADWVFSGETNPGDYAALISEDGSTAYLVELESWGEDAALVSGREALRAQQLSQDMETVVENASVSYRSLGQRLIGR